MASKIQPNTPDLWRSFFPKKQAESHKYDYGHALIYGASALTGASRLAAMAAARMGAGLVTVLSDPAVVNVYRTALPAHIMVRDDLTWWDERVKAVLYGPGGLPCEVSLRDDLAVVLDADALSVLPENLSENVVLTPHEGEFARAFPDLKGSRLERALAASAQTGAVVVLKGPETVITHPDGRTALNTHASADLATAGTGDVLAGMITGLLAQGVPLFEASCGAVWIHGEAAQRFGRGLVASDLQDLIPEVLQEILGFSE